MFSRSLRSGVCVQGRLLRASSKRCLVGKCVTKGAGIESKPKTCVMFWMCVTPPKDACVESLVSSEPVLKGVEI